MGMKIFYLNSYFLYMKQELKKEHQKNLYIACADLEGGGCRGGPDPPPPPPGGLKD